MSDHNQPRSVGANDTALCRIITHVEDKYCESFLGKLFVPLPSPAVSVPPGSSLLDQLRGPIAEHRAESAPSGPPRGAA